MSEATAISESTDSSTGTSSHRVRTFLLIWLGVAALFLGSHHSFYFQEANYEGGDAAANALQIREAKTFHELHGNYSRFRFHHPGPAFFYAYALGETLLCDTLKVVPTPYNAHAITGIFLQSFFFAWALSIVAKRVRRRLFIPLVLLFAALHFGLVNHSLSDSAFESIWPPYVLLLPFLCFLVAAASVASGEVGDLIPLVLSGCLLVHGHVAQPLFVLPLFVLAYVALCFRRSPEGRRGLFQPLRQAPYTHLCALGILLVFLLPIALDLARGSESNFRLIVHHFSQYADDRKTVAQSLTYLAAFFCYVGRPEAVCDQLTSSSLGFLTERWYFPAMWAGVAIITVTLFNRLRRKEHGFAGWLSICFAIAILLTFVWGKLQNKEMFAFNAHFNFAILFVPFILLAIALSASFELPKALGAMLCAGAIGLSLMGARNWNWNSHLPSVAHGTEPIVRLIRQAALEDRQSSRAKFLSFEHKDWPWAIGVALALERMGYDFAIPPSWGFMFGDKHRADLVTALSREEVALWEIKSPEVGFDKWISHSIPSIDPAHGEITFYGNAANGPAMAVSGWDLSDGIAARSNTDLALLYFEALPSSSDVQIDLQVVPPTSPASSTQPFSISFNNGAPESFVVADRSTISVRVTRDVWNHRRHATLAVFFPAPAAATKGDPTSNKRGGFARIDFHLVNATSINEQAGSGRLRGTK